MKKLSDEEQKFWDNTSLYSACADVLGLEVVEALSTARVAMPKILEMVAMECFLFPDKLGAVRHYERIRKTNLILRNGGHLTYKEYYGEN